MNAFIFLCLLPIALASDLCTRKDSDIRAYLAGSSSRIAFKNDGGLIDGGVCWWHSRLQRASSYLVRFAPDLPPPSAPELSFILLNLRTLKRVITIPGYADFQTFTHDYQFQIQAMLEDWQKIDGFLNFQWLRGISGSSSLPPGEMAKRMKEIYSSYKASPVPLWLMAQIKGITSHSFLLTEMEETQSGFTLSVIDSNHPSETFRIEYVSGDSSLKHDGYTFVPYTGFQNDFRMIFRSLSQSCRDSFMEVPVNDGEIELSSQY